MGPIEELAGEPDAEVAKQHAVVAQSLILIFSA
jgi:hypothetical protein